MKLTMNIAADGDRCSDRLGIGLVGKDVHGFFGDEFDIFFGDGFECFQVFDDGVDIVVGFRHEFSIYFSNSE